MLIWPSLTKNDEQLGIQNHPVTIGWFHGEIEEEEANKNRGLVGGKVTAKI
jgi:hypothetical protein